MEVRQYVGDFIATRPLRQTFASGQPVWNLRVLKDVVIPEGVEQIGCYWFAQSSIETVVIAASVREIKREAFCECERLRTVSFAENSRLERVGSRAFSKTAITSFVAPENLREIGQLAFYDCEQLETVRLSEATRELGPMCFLNTGIQNVLFL